MADDTPHDAAATDAAAATDDSGGDPSPRPGSPGGPLWDPDAIPAATVIVVRDAEGGGTEVLMLQRNRDLRFAGGMWVFPGGRIDEGDRAAGDPTDDQGALETAARRAAVREAMEEAAIAVDEASLRRWSHWTPPQLSDHRFTTAFFVAPATDATADVVVDDGEIHGHRWASPAEVIALRDAGEITLAPPTYITLRQLLPHAGVDALLAAAEEQERSGSIEHFATRVVTQEGGWTAVYHGDVLYEAAGGHGATAGNVGSDDGDETPLDLDAEGPRHRLLMEDVWTYVREGC